MHFLLPALEAYTENPAISKIIGKLADNILNPIIELIFAVATVIFIWGVFQYFIKSNDSTARKTGTDHILWGIVGMSIMVCAYGILNFVFSSIGL
jgi:hypothetical protein